MLRSTKKPVEYGFKDLAETQLTVSNVLRLVREDILWAHYSGSCSLNKAICAPYRKDRHPSFSLRMDYRGRIMFKDFGTGAYGDIFNYLNIVYGDSLVTALLRINRDFKLGLDSQDNLSITGNAKPYTKSLRPQEKRDEILKEKSAKLIQIVPRRFNESDLRYWKKFGITENTLSFYRVHCVKKVFLDRVKIYEAGADGKDPCFAYHFPKSNHLKCYFPERKGENNRFVSNTNNFQDIQGYYQCSVKTPGKDKFLILTKSMKDCMCLHELGYEAMAIHGEGHYFNTDFIRHIKKYYPYIASIYDRDKTGIRGALHLWREHGIVPFFLPPKLRSNDCKDVSDLYSIHGQQELSTFIAQTKEQTKKVINRHKQNRYKNG